jgi:hypothetical protein
MLSNIGELCKLVWSPEGGFFLFSLGHLWEFASKCVCCPSAPMLMFHSALIAAHNGRLCKSAASPCAASYLFSRHFLSSDMPRGVGSRREFEIYEVLPLSRQRNVFPLAQIAMRNADWLRLFYILDIYPRLCKGNCESTRLKAMNVRCHHHPRNRVVFC